MSADSRLILEVTGAVLRGPLRRLSMCITEPEMRSRAPEMRSRTPEMRSRTSEMRSRTPELRWRTPAMRSRIESGGATVLHRSGLEERQEILCLLGWVRVFLEKCSFDLLSGLGQSGPVCYMLLNFFLRDIFRTTYFVYRLHVSFSKLLEQFCLALRGG